MLQPLNCPPDADHHRHGFSLVSVVCCVWPWQEGGLEIEQVDGAGAGPAKKRKTGLDTFDADEDDDGGDLGGAAAASKCCFFLSSRDLLLICMQRPT
jgi:hypothetical protein